MFEDLEQKFKRILFSRAQQQAFLEDVSSLIEDGVPLTQAIETICQITTGVNQEMAQNVMQKIAQGRSIADGLAGWFPNSTVEIIRAGEEGGTLPETMLAASRALAAGTSAIGALLGAMVYPVIVICMALGVSVLINTTVFANFAQIKPMSEWPLSGQILAHLATFVQYWWWFILLVLVALSVTVAYTLRNLVGKPREIMDNIPILSLYRYLMAARIMETLGILLANGVIFKKAIGILHQGANNYLSWHLLDMEFRLSGGKENIGDVLETGLIPKADILRLKVIAKGKGFEHALIRLGRQMAIKNQKTVQVTSKILGGFLLGFGAILAAFMIFTIYTIGSFVST